MRQPHTITYRNQKLLKMHKLSLILKVLFAFGLIVSNLHLFAQRKMEKLDRGVVAVRTSPTTVYIGWRLLGNDTEGVAFNVYRGSTKLNATPILATTNLVDTVSTNNTYTVRAVVNGVEQTASKPTTVWANQYIDIPLQIPTGGTTPDGVDYTYTANDCSVATASRPRPSFRSGSA